MNGLVPWVVLMRSVRATLVAIPLGSLSGGLIFALLLGIQEGSFAALPATFLVGAFVALGGAVISLVPAIAYGAVVHAFLMTRQWANYVTSLLVGILPGLAWIPFDSGGGVFIIAFGGPIGLLTHWQVTKSLRMAKPLA